MKNITLSDSPQLTSTDVPDKPRRISKKVRAAIDAMVTGDVKTIADAARGAGLGREHLSRELSKPHIAEHMRQRVLRSLSVASARAGPSKSTCSTARPSSSGTAPRASSWASRGSSPPPSRMSV